MSVGILIITHAQIGKTLLHTACDILGFCPLRVFSLDIFTDEPVEEQKKQAQAALQLLDQGDGVLIFTDLYGSTPSNIAQSLLIHDHIYLISGLNLPMLIKTLNYAHEPLEQLAQRALQGGQNSILMQGWCRHN